MPFDVGSWWLFLCAVSALNVVGWSSSAMWLPRRRDAYSAEVHAARRWQVVLSAGYVFGCAYRSVWPVHDVQRICMFDSWLSSIVVGRSVATVAELCFVAQWALMLREVSRATGSGVGATVSKVVLPLILIAEACSWYSVLTTSNFGHVVEESIWGLSVALLVASLVAIWPRCDTAARSLLAAWCSVGVAYVAFMFLVDVPMYWSRWVADEAGGRLYTSFAQGLAEVSSRCLVSHRWEDWQHEVAWMTLYFSVAVWLSIALIHAPVLERRTSSGQGGRVRVTVARLRRRTSAAAM